MQYFMQNTYRKAQILSTEACAREKRRIVQDKNFSLAALKTAGLSSILDNERRYSFIWKARLFGAAAMLTKEENDLLTMTGPGSPAGALLRSYWLPAALSEELPPDGAPVRIRLLGESLVLFRDDQGQPGLLGLHCPHRGADLAMGRIENGGLRCLYHGWWFDRIGFS